MNVRRWFGRVKPLIGLALLYLVARQIDLEELDSLTHNEEPLLLWLAVAGFLAAFGLFQALRLHVLVVRYTGGLPSTLRLFFVGVFFNNLLPSNVGGDAVRLLYLRNLAGGQWKGPLSMLMLHRVSGLMALLGLCGVYLLLFWRRMLEVGQKIELAWVPPTWAYWVVLLGGPLVLAGLLALLLRTAKGRNLAGRISGLWRSFVEAYRSLSRSERLWLIGLTLALHISRTVAFYWALLYCGAVVQPWDVIPVLTLGALLALLPITVGGLGVLEGSLTVGLGLFGVAAGPAVAAALLQRLSMVALALIGGLVYATERSRIHVPVSESPAEPT